MSPMILSILSLMCLLSMLSTVKSDYQWTYVYTDASNCSHTPPSTIKYELIGPHPNLSPDALPTACHADGCYQEDGYIAGYICVTGDDPEESTHISLERTYYTVSHWAEETCYENLPVKVEYYESGVCNGYSQYICNEDGTDVTGFLGCFGECSVSTCLYPSDSFANSDNVCIVVSGSGQRQKCIGPDIPAFPTKPEEVETTVEEMPVEETSATEVNGDYVQTIYTGTECTGPVKLVYLMNEPGYDCNNPPSVHQGCVASATTSSLYTCPTYTECEDYSTFVRDEECDPSFGIDATKLRDPCTTFRNGGSYLFNCAGDGSVKYQKFDSDDCTGTITEEIYQQTRCFDIDEEAIQCPGDFTCTFGRTFSEIGTHEAPEISSATGDESSDEPENNSFHSITILTLSLIGTLI